MKRNTGLADRNGNAIHEGDWVSLDGNMTADDSMGLLPNGWMFDAHHVYRVMWEGRINNWTLDVPSVDPFTNPLDCKFMNHATSLLHEGDVDIVDGPQEANA